jgi:glyoxylase-like metal-dependent hydrolase (beta-lactamase superfamily II)
MNTHFSSITDNCFLFADICNVYVIRKGRRALCVDFGSGHVLEHLGEIGVDQVAGILHTHHHRDQAQGDDRAVSRGIPIHVPQHERQLFDQVEIWWSTKQLYDIYNVRNTYFTLAKSVPVAGVLEDWARFEWEGLSLNVSDRICRRPPPLPGEGDDALRHAVLVRVYGRRGVHHPFTEPSGGARA